MTDIKTHLLWAVALLLALAMILTLIGYLVHDYQATRRTAMQSGLVEKADPGQGFHWEKP